MINQCYECKYANEYLLPYWFPKYPPTCELGEPMHTNHKCENYQLIGRQSR